MPAGASAGRLHHVPDGMISLSRVVVGARRRDPRVMGTIQSGELRHA